MSNTSTSRTRSVLPELHRLDDRVHRAVRGHFGDPASATVTATVTVSKTLSWCGEHAGGWIVLGLAGAAVDTERRGNWLRATGTVAAAHLASMAIKRVVRRPRPGGPGLEPLVSTAGRHSFPSSHATSSAAAALAFAPLLPVSALAPAAGAVCLSRLVVGVHYLSDVAGGAALGAGIAAAGRSWISKGCRSDG
ncbi:phosphatase PAP2 family protein [Kitasatospora sp. NPDC050543]|uniref:phosphatase PAP2 family protein n=1 Tax=Kitasatospora sp. NPDC050543 TaxID=3364054 RepID=UPI0037B2ACD6